MSVDEHAPEPRKRRRAEIGRTRPEGDGIRGVGLAQAPGGLGHKQWIDRGQSDSEREQPGAAAPATGRQPEREGGNGRSGNRDVQEDGRGDAFGEPTERHATRGERAPVSGRP
jgi:hypothetical protein